MARWSLIPQVNSQVTKLQDFRDLTYALGTEFPGQLSYDCWMYSKIAEAAMILIVPRVNAAMSSQN
jgi:hypothetical protein